MAKRFKLRLRDITPRGLYPRSVLMVVLPVILLLTAVTYIFYDSHWRHTSNPCCVNRSPPLIPLTVLLRRYPTPVAGRRGA